MHMELCGNMPNISWEGVGREDYQGGLQGRDVVGAESKRLSWCLPGRIRVWRWGKAYSVKRLVQGEWLVQRSMGTKTSGGTSNGWNIKYTHLIIKMITAPFVEHSPFVQGTVLSTLHGLPHLICTYNPSHRWRNWNTQRLRNWPEGLTTH